MAGARKVAPEVITALKTGQPSAMAHWRIWTVLASPCANRIHAIGALPCGGVPCSRLTMVHTPVAAVLAETVRSAVVEVASVSALRKTVSFAEISAAPKTGSLVAPAGAAHTAASKAVTIHGAARCKRCLTIPPAWTRADAASIAFQPVTPYLEADDG